MTLCDTPGEPLNAANFLGALLAETAGLPVMFRVVGLLPVVLACLALFLPVLRKIDGDLVPVEVA